MRSPPYPAAEDEPLAGAFGPAQIEGRTVICAAAHATAGRTWNAAVLRDAEGRLFLLEREGPPGGAPSVRAAPLDRETWTSVVERLIASPGAVGDLDAWMRLLADLREEGPEWSADAEDETFGRLQTAVEARQLQAQSLRRALRAVIEPDLDRAIEHGSEATGDVGLVAAFGPEPLRGKTLVWSLVDLHGRRPWRGCVLMDDDGASYAAEITTDAGGRPSASLDRLGEPAWRRMAALAFCRMADHGHDHYAAAAEGVSRVNLAIDPELTKDPDAPWGRVGEYVETVLSEMAEAGARRDAGLRPN